MIACPANGPPAKMPPISCSDGEILNSEGERIDMERRAKSVIVQDPEILSGEPVFRGTRVPFQSLLDYLEAGDTLDQFLEQFPGVTRADAIAALEEAKALVLARFSK
jgi:uncharacterized protein (DUF433 family)